MAEQGLTHAIALRRGTLGALSIAGLLIALAGGCAAHAPAMPQAAEKASAAAVQPTALPPPAALKQLLAELEAALPPENLHGFRQTQQQWADYARADCEWRRSLTDGGSAGAPLYARCMAEKSRQRVGELKWLLCEGFGLTGACEASLKFDRLAD